MSQPEHIRTAILHGAGYVGRELIRLVSVHPLLDLSVVTSRSHAGEPIHVAGTLSIDRWQGSARPTLKVVDIAEVERR